MMDPLSSTSGIFGGDDSIPPWPTTPHTPNSPIPNLPRASPSATPTASDGPATGLYGKEAQIYGQPEPGLISPRDALRSDGTRLEKPEPYLRVRITGLDRNRRDVLIKFDAQTNLTNFTGTTYRNISRSYLEFQQFYEAIVQNTPQTIVPALPLTQTSAPTDEEDDRLVKIMLQRWITRVCEDPILLNDEDLRAFIESDFGYQPTPRTRKRASSSFGLMRRSVPDEDEELQRARFELTKLESQFFDTAKALDKLALTRKSLAAAQAEMGNKLISVATAEAHPPLGNALRKIGRVWHSLADLDQAQAISECVIIGDSFGYQGMNARSAKETLQQRTAVLEEYQAAVKSTISKRRHIERLKASTNIRSDRVTDALEDMEEANKYEQILAQRAEGISQNLHRSLQTHNRYANDDLTTALIEYARSSIMYEKQLLRELESLRPDVANAAKKVVPPADGAPKPTIIPPLEDFSKPPPPPPEIVHPVVPSIANRPPPIQSPLPSANSTYSREGPRSTISSFPSVPRDLSVSSSLFVPSQGATSPASPVSSIQSSSREDPLSASLPSPLERQQRLPLPPLPESGPPSPPVPSPSSPAPPVDEPPLGGRFVVSSKSMYVKTTQSPLSSSFPSPSSAVSSPGPLPRAQSASVGHSATFGRATSSPLTPHGANGRGGEVSFDPLGQAKVVPMLGSMRVQPTRPRLDAREAASKLANMF